VLSGNSIKHEPVPRDKASLRLSAGAAAAGFADVLGEVFRSCPSITRPPSAEATSVHKAKAPEISHKRFGDESVGCEVDMESSIAGSSFDDIEILPVPYSGIAPSHERCNVAYDFLLIGAFLPER